MPSRSLQRCAMRNTSKSKFRLRRQSRGLAAVEFALVLPVLLLLMLSVYDFARTIQANMILVNISREGAHLASRNSGYGYQRILDSLAATTPPLDMSAAGMMYVTKLMGHGEKGGAVRNIVLEQYRWVRGWERSHYSPDSRVWNCGDGGRGHWAGDGSCAGLPSPGDGSPSAQAMQGQLADGDVVYAVEIYYLNPSLFGGTQVGGGLEVPALERELYAITLL